jgi:hypothetical protein
MPYDEKDGGPLALKQAGFRGFAFTFGGTDVWMPDLDDEQVRLDLQKLIAALGSRYGNNAAVDSIDLGLIGDWGEQHFWDTRPTPPYPSPSTLKWLSDTFRAHFRVPVLVNDGIWENNPQAFQDAVRSGLGWRVDCWGGQREMTTKYPRCCGSMAPRAGDIGALWRDGRLAVGRLSVAGKPSMGDRQSRVADQQQERAYPQRDDRRGEDHAGKNGI